MLNGTTMAPPATTTGTASTSLKTTISLNTGTTTGSSSSASSSGAPSTTVKTTTPTTIVTTTPSTTTVATTTPSTTTGTTSKNFASLNYDKLIQPSGRVLQPSRHITSRSLPMPALSTHSDHLPSTTGYSPTPEKSWTNFQEATTVLNVGNTVDINDGQTLFTLSGEMRREIEGKNPIFRCQQCFLSRRCRQLDGFYICIIWCHWKYYFRRRYGSEFEFYKVKQSHRHT